MANAEAVVRLPGLQALAQTRKIGTLTHCNFNLTVDLARRAQLPWHFILSADALRDIWPGLGIYLPGMALFGIKPSFRNTAKACMVAANLQDLRAAKRFGMTTVFVSARPTEAALPPEGKPSYVDIVVQDLVELAHLASPMSGRGSLAISFLAMIHR